ncbi:MAG: hypothetical protein ILO34_02915, partial [Kiritimatiellae bacterium]|nr:hypothetical protein [Kiritimatiellia bacterium]
FRGHHEIEFFVLERGAAPERMVSSLEDLYSKLKSGEIGQLGAIQMIDEAAKLYESLLSRPEFADEESQTFAETIYMYLTGEIYSVVGEGSIPAFDDRRTALPGGGFVDGRPIMHPGSDARTGVLFSTLVEMMSKGEKIEYANVYEIRDEDNLPIGKGRTREIVFKTNLRPLESSLIEKTLSSAKKGYGDYLLARIGALRALGISLSGYYRLLPRSAGSGRHDHYFRFRCEGETMDSIPANYFGTTEDSSIEDPEVVCGLATLMGDAAAQNMAMKKYDARSSSALYGVGKEIYAFEYDIIRERVVPKSVSICSIRGSLGWPCLDRTEENLSNIAGWYLAYFAHALKEFQKKHRVPMRELAERFFGGFEYRTHAMVWQMSIMRDRFEAFAPELRRVYDFQEKWSFVMWALERQDRRLPILKKKFFEKVRVLEDEEGRDNPQ